MQRFDLQDCQWELIADLFPDNDGKEGGRWKDHRTVLNGMFHVLHTGCPWRDLPERYGPWQTVYDRFARYRRDGTFDAILRRLRRGGFGSKLQPDLRRPRHAAGGGADARAGPREQARRIAGRRRAGRPAHAAQACRGRQGVHLPTRAADAAGPAHHAGDPDALEPAPRSGLRPRRNVVERLVGWLKERRRLCTRFEKLADSYVAMVKLAFTKCMLLINE